MSLLAVDIGNTNITLGVFEEGALVCKWRIVSQPYRTADEYICLLTQYLNWRGSQPERMILGSVAPVLLSQWEEVGAHLNLVTRVVRPRHPDIIPLHVDTPEEVGVDRIVNSWAALQNYNPPLLVIDFGTATTFDLVGEAGDYQGGLILPGLETGAEALFRKTALLPQVSLKKPASVIGANTVDCIQAGLYYGWLEMTRGLVRRYREAVSESLEVISTGGIARVFGEDMDFVDAIEPDLTLNGLCWLDARWDSLGMPRP